MSRPGRKERERSHHDLMAALAEERAAREAAEKREQQARQEAERMRQAAQDALTALRARG